MIPESLERTLKHTSDGAPSTDEIRELAIEVRKNCCQQTESEAPTNSLMKLLLLLLVSDATLKRVVIEITLDVLYTQTEHFSYSLESYCEIVGKDTIARLQAGVKGGAKQ